MDKTTIECYKIKNDLAKSDDLEELRNLAIKETEGVITPGVLLGCSSKKPGNLKYVLVFCVCWIKWDN
jgi:hypothetical protein